MLADLAADKQCAENQEDADQGLDGGCKRGGFVLVRHRGPDAVRRGGDTVLGDLVKTIQVSQVGQCEG